ncbi:hypothetical protein Cgig2_008589 [Carnegiea gigantea]|uniref:Retrotransposon Copia-like N-terminal domain-containing protein n=1 Tax=Carnegiea gigantea TaxID=171969 RepID=A0A9Q1GNT8_9CARY|nr:hypothetical protein Cgig2_008589 [Carnegiea gigantea]
MAETLENPNAPTENCVHQMENRVPLSNYNLDPRHVLYLHHSDNPNCTMSTDPLTGSNYAQWRRSCERHYTSHGTPVSSRYPPQATHYGSQPPVQYHAIPTGRKPNVQCNYCRRPGHTIDKSYKLQSLRRQTKKGKRLAATAQNTGSGLPFVAIGSDHSTEQQGAIGHHTVTYEQYEQLIALLSK